MAMGYRFTCNHCGFGVEAWDEGNPFYVDDEGNQQFCYHPGGEHAIPAFIKRAEEKLKLRGKKLKEFIETRTGNMREHLCMSCAEPFELDDHSRTRVCSHCGSAKVHPAWELKGKPCPKCRKGKFDVDERSMMIS